jgi:hypothetical protein
MEKEGIDSIELVEMGLLALELNLMLMKLISLNEQKR